MKNVISQVTTETSNFYYLYITSIEVKMQIKIHRSKQEYTIFCYFSATSFSTNPQMDLNP